MRRSTFVVLSASALLFACGGATATHLFGDPAPADSTAPTATTPGTTPTSTSTTPPSPTLPPPEPTTPPTTPPKDAGGPPRDASVPDAAKPDAPKSAGPADEPPLTIAVDPETNTLLLVGSSGSVTMTLNDKPVHSYRNFAGRGGLKPPSTNKHTGLSVR